MITFLKNSKKKFQKSFQKKNFHHKKNFHQEKKNFQKKKFSKKKIFTKKNFHQKKISNKNFHHKKKFNKVHMFNYLYKIYPRLFKDYKMLYQDTDSIYAKLNISHDEYLEILEENKDLFGKNIGMMEPEYIDNPIKEFIALSSKCYSYICKNDIENNKNILKNNIVHTKGIADSYKVKYIDHDLFKKTLIENMKPDKISFNNISVKNQQIKTNKIVKNNIEFLNDKRYISHINENIPHTLYID